MKIGSIYKSVTIVGPPFYEGLKIAYPVKCNRCGREFSLLHEQLDGSELCDCSKVEEPEKPKIVLKKKAPKEESTSKKITFKF